MAPYVGILRAAGLAKEVAVGTLIDTPTAYLPYIPPDGFTPEIAVLESAGIRFQADKVIKAQQGPGVVKGAKLKLEAEPENIGEILMATFGTDTLTGDANLGYSHKFTRANVPQLPTYSFWFDKGVKYPLFAGCMLSKFDLDVKAKEHVVVDTDWTALRYDDTGTIKAPTYSAYKPFVWHQAVVKVDTVQVNDYDNLKISVDNFVNAEHALGGSIWTSKIWSEGMRVTISADLFFENATQYAKFLAGTTAAFNVKLTSGENIPGTAPLTPFTLEVDLPIVHYTAAPLVNPTGVMKVPFAGVVRYDSVAAYSIAMTLKNSKAVAY